MLAAQPAIVFLPAVTAFSFGNIAPDMRVLVVEDQPDAALVLANALRENGYAVDVNGDGESACVSASVNDYDVIVLDVMLPKRDGFSVCRELRQSGRATGQNLVVIPIRSVRGKPGEIFVLLSALT
jgi:CheY-like chemotaxis protein